MKHRNPLTQTINDMVRDIFLPIEPGAAVIAVRDGEIIFRNGQGMANLELGVSIAPDMVFRLGSITKQFTAVAVLMLVEQGKLTLDDPITWFLPDYPIPDHIITIEHLLTHTSGIKSYTDMPEMGHLIRNDFTVKELIDFFKFQPMQFISGQRWAYNNSGYILLGAIIEKISGQSYEQFISKKIFEPLGMKQSYYDNPLRMIPRRVAGYDKTPDGFTNAAYMSMTSPYAGGSLASTVDDLAKWDAALYTEQLVKQDTIEMAFTPHLIADGTSTGYGYGWEIGDYEGHRLIEHGGCINGFNTYAIRIPDAKVFVAVLSNVSGAESEPLAFKIAAEVIGQPYHVLSPPELPPGVPDRYAGIYQNNLLEEKRILCEAHHLFYESEPGRRIELVPVSSEEFILKDMVRYRLRFLSDANGIIAGAEMRGRSGIPEKFKRIDNPVPGAMLST